MPKTPQSSFRILEPWTSNRKPAYSVEPPAISDAANDFLARIATICTAVFAQGNRVSCFVCEPRVGQSWQIQIKPEVDRRFLRVDRLARAIRVNFKIDGELGFDACVDHKAADFGEKLQAAASTCIDGYFENVGGAVFDAVLPLLNTGARVPVCGLISQYNATGLPGGPDRLSMLMGQVVRKRLTLRGFIIFQDFGDLFAEFTAAMVDWLAAGQMHYREDMIDGLEQAPQAFIGLLRGENFGKRVARIGPTVLED